GRSPSPTRLPARRAARPRWRGAARAALRARAWRGRERPWPGARGRPGPRAWSLDLDHVRREELLLVLLHLIDLLLRDLEREDEDGLIGRAVDDHLRDRERLAARLERALEVDPPRVERSELRLGARERLALVLQEALRLLED